MRYIKIKDARPGMNLAYNMYDANGKTLLCSGNVLSEFSIEKLIEHGFDGIYITDELSKDIKIEPVISPELRAEGIACVRERDVDKCKHVASKIVGQVLSNGVWSLDLTDLRCFDGYIYAHSVNVAVLCCIIGYGLKMKEEELEQLVLAGLLHDFGKLMISPDILEKPTRLTPEEFEIMKTHPARSYEMIKDRWDISANVKAAVRYHHENVDGSGYPEGLEGDELTIYTKILHVADVYDALVSKRPYKNPYLPYEAGEYLMGGGGILFDPAVVEAFLLHVPFYPKGTQIKLSDGREGIIVENAATRNLRPLLRMLDGTMVDLERPAYFNLTIVHGTDEEIVRINVAEEERRKMLMPSRKSRIMIIADKLIHLQAIQGILHHMYELNLLTSPKQALLHLKRQGEPDLIILDFGMTEMNGIEAAAQIKEILGDSVPILFVIEDSDRETINKCRKAGAAGYIVRPFKPTYVKAEIRRILTGQQMAE